MGPGFRRGAYVVGVSFAIEDGPAHYLPIAHESGDNLPREAVFEYLKDQARSFRGEIVGANLQYDLDGLAQEGIWFGGAQFFRDVQIAEPLIDELQFSYSLEAIAGRYGIPGKAEDHLDRAARAWGLDPKQDLWKLPARHVGAYAEQDARLPLAILRRQERKIEEQNLWKIFNLESRVLPVLVKMKRRGVRIDFEKLDSVEKWLNGEIAKTILQVNEAVPKEGRWSADDLWKDKAIGRTLESVGLTVLKTKKGRYRTDKDYLLSIDHPVGKLINQARKMGKILQFADQVRAYACNGRIYPNFKQLVVTQDSGDEEGARYGRMSCTDPNLQQQPSPEKDPEISGRWRQIYVPDEGGQWACLDFSAQEPRMAVHYGVRKGFPGAAEIAEEARTNPKWDLHTSTSKLMGVPRKAAKIIYLGLSYGMGSGKLARSLGLPTQWVFSKRQGKNLEVAGPEGEALLKKFHEMVPFVKGLSDAASLAAASRGYITTILGRRCRFPQNERGEYEWTHKALNRLIQGSSADQTKQAMVDCDAAGCAIQLQVHDELDLTVYNRSEAELVGSIMENAVQLKIPSKAEAKIAANWGEAK